MPTGGVRQAAAASGGKRPLPAPSSRRQQPPQPQPQAQPQQQALTPQSLMDWEARLEARSRALAAETEQAVLPLRTRFSPASFSPA